MKNIFPGMKQKMLIALFLTLMAGMSGFAQRGGGGHGVLAIVRSLGRRGIPVWVASSALPLARSSRYTLASLPWDDSLAAQARAEWLLEVAHRHHLQRWVLIAGDAAWHELQIENARQKSGYPGVLVDEDRDETFKTLQRLHLARHTVRIVPTHDHQAALRLSPSGLNCPGSPGRAAL